MDQVIDTPCAGCGVTLTAENLAAVTTTGVRNGPMGVCKACKPEGSVPAGMLGRGDGSS